MGQGLHRLPAAAVVRNCVVSCLCARVCVVQVIIEKGMRNDDKIVFRGQADEAPGVEPGDLIFVIREAEHGVFKRAGCDLIMRKEISLREALTGVRFTVTHLDGTPVIVTSSAGQVGSCVLHCPFRRM